jgi:hypothetical protein
LEQTVNSLTDQLTSLGQPLGKRTDPPSSLPAAKRTHR